MCRLKPLLIKSFTLKKISFSRGYHRNGKSGLLIFERLSQKRFLIIMKRERRVFGKQFVMSPFTELQNLNHLARRTWGQIRGSNILYYMCGNEVTVHQTNPSCRFYIWSPKEEETHGSRAVYVTISWPGIHDTWPPASFYLIHCSAIIIEKCRDTEMNLELASSLNTSRAGCDESKHG